MTTFSKEVILYKVERCVEVDIRVLRYRFYEKAEVIDVFPDENDRVHSYPPLINEWTIEEKLFRSSDHFRWQSRSDGRDAPQLEKKLTEGVFDSLSEALDAAIKLQEKRIASHQRDLDFERENLVRLKEIPR